jgi:GDSL-like Lipase/Acylhydrolase family
VTTNPAGHPSKLNVNYRGLALMALNTVLAFVGLNLIAALWLAVSADPEVEGALVYGLDRLERVYPGRTRGEIERLLRETWSREYAYEPYTQFKEGAIDGEFVNVGPEGFRDTAHGLPWPPVPASRAVFVFGGSTTFGYGVADGEAIPARLQDELTGRCGTQVPVYNLARSNYFSTQENVLFQRLLADDVQPTVAVFVDGLNEFGHPDDDPKFTLRLDYMMRETPLQMARRLVVGLPLARLVKRSLGGSDLKQTRDAVPGDTDRVVRRWLVNREQIRAVAAEAGVWTLFVWQPIPTYGYDLEYHLFGGGLEMGDDGNRLGYKSVNRLRRDPKGPLTEDFLWLADMQRERREPLYVDQVHYTAAFSAEIAVEIASAIAPRLCAAGAL